MDEPSSSSSQPSTPLANKGPDPFVKPDKSGKPASIKDISKRLRDEEGSAPRSSEPAQNVQDSEDTSSQANTKESNPGEMTPEEKRKFKLKTKIDGVEEEHEYDEDQARLLIQKGLAAERRFHSASEKEKRATEVLSALKDPNRIGDLLQSLGYDVDQLAEQRVYERLKMEAMTPQERRLAELEQQMAMRDEQDKSTKAQQEAAQRAEASQKGAVALQTEIMGVLKAGFINPTAENVWKVGNKMRISLERGIDLSAEDAAKMVKQDILKELRSTTKGMPADQLVEMFGQEVADNIRRHDLSKVKNPIPESRPKDSTPRPPKPPGRHYITEKEFKNHMARQRMSK